MTNSIRRRAQTWHYEAPEQNDADVRCINKSGTDLVSGKDYALIAMKAQIANLKKKMVVSLAKTTTLEEHNIAFDAARNADENRNRDFNRNKGISNGGTKRKFPDWKKKEDKQTCIIDGKTYMYRGERWKKTRLTEKHIRGFTGDTDTQKQANMNWSHTVARSQVFSDF
jgi:hypothetical protein